MTDKKIELLIWIKQQCEGPDHEHHRVDERQHINDVLILINTTMSVLRHTEYHARLTGTAQNIRSQYAFVGSIRGSVDINKLSFFCHRGSTHCNVSRITQVSTLCAIRYREVILLRFGSLS